MAAFRYVWDCFLANCKRVFIPSDCVTIDEQLVPFRGRCKFMQYMPSKPAKYGIKIFWMCDARVPYAIDGMIYTGRQPGEEVQRNLGANIVQQLSSGFRQTGEYRIQKWIYSWSSLRRTWPLWERFARTSRTYRLSWSHPNRGRSIAQNLDSVATRPWWAMCRKRGRLLSSWAPCMMTEQWMTTVWKRNQKWSSTITKQNLEWTQWIRWFAPTHASGEHGGGPWCFGTMCWMLPPSMPTLTSLHNTLITWVAWPMHGGSSSRSWAKSL